MSAPESLAAALEAERENGALYEKLMEAAGGCADAGASGRRKLPATWSSDGEGPPVDPCMLARTPQMAKQDKPDNAHYARF